MLLPISHQDFQAILFPAILKALKRSPEIALPGLLLAHLLFCSQKTQMVCNFAVVEHIFKVTSLDVSRYAVELVTAIATSISSADAAVRSLTSKTIINVIKKSSDSTVAQSLQELISAIYDGKHGKLTLTEQRVNLLSVIPAFNKAPLTTAAKHQIATTFADKLVAVSKAV